MKYRFEQCLQRGKIVCIPVDHELVAKGLGKRAGSGCCRAFSHREYEVGDHQGYYARFTPYVPLSFLEDTEKSHSCLRYAVEALCRRRPSPGIGIEDSTSPARGKVRIMAVFFRSRARRAW